MFRASPDLNAWIADRIGPPVLQSSLLKMGERLNETSRTLSYQEPSKEEFGDVTRKDGAIGK